MTCLLNGTNDIGVQWPKRLRLNKAWSLTKIATKNCRSSRLRFEGHAKDGQDDKVFLLNKDLYFRAPRSQVWFKKTKQKNEGGVIAFSVIMEGVKMESMTCAFVVSLQPQWGSSSLDGKYSADRPPPIEYGMSNVYCVISRLAFAIA